MGSTEIPVGLGLIALLLFLIALVNLFTKQEATIFGSLFTGVFFAILTVSERITSQRRVKNAGMEKFKLQVSDSVNLDMAGVRPGSTLVAVRDPESLRHLQATLERSGVPERDVMVMTVRLMTGADFAEELAGDQNLLSEYEQMLFTRVVSLAEKTGKPVSLMVVPGTDPEDAIVLAAQRLHSSLVVVGRSPVASAQEKALAIGRCWERLPHPRPHVTLQVIGADGATSSFLLGPHAPELHPEDQEFLHRLWLELTERPELRGMHHREILSVALRRLATGLRGPDQEAIRAELRRVSLAEPRERR